MKKIFNQLLIFQLGNYKISDFFSIIKKKVRQRPLDDDYSLGFSYKSLTNRGIHDFIKSMEKNLEGINSGDAHKSPLITEDKNMNEILSFKEKHPKLFQISYEEVKRMLKSFETKPSAKDYQHALELLLRNIHSEKILE